ncbi:hypothetical protein IKG28_00385 [Candidatus Saccharibacteria bacterium]|nr:hypothetical protein [Candidatus Saccharibacteria bacterium]MBR3332083.1 hypothetical protein [Candidatus Saccharibacteria bacterium]
MTEEELIRELPDLPSSFVKAILEWNVAHPGEDDQITLKFLKEAERCASALRTHIEFEELLSDSSDIAYAMLIKVIGRFLTENIGRNPKLEQYLERYIFDILSLKWGDGKTADEVKPLKK